MADWPLLIRAYRKEHGLKQTVLAYMLNVDQTTVSRWERGKDRPSVAIQKRLRDLFCSQQDCALSAVSRTVRFSPGRAAIMVPGTRIVEISDGYFELFKVGRNDMRGGLMRHFVGDDFYQKYMVPVGDAGIYSGEVARVDYVAPVLLDDGTRRYSHSSVVPVFGSHGVYSVSHSQFVSSEYANSRPSMRLHRFDELID